MYLLGTIIMHCFLQKIEIRIELQLLVDEVA